MLVFSVKMERPAAAKNNAAETVTMKFATPDGTTIEGQVHFFSCSESGRARVGFDFPESVDILRQSLASQLNGSR